MDVESVRRKITQIGQQQTLRFWDSLDEAGRNRLIKRLGGLDLDHVQSLAKEYVLQKPPVELPVDIQPVEAYPRQADAARQDFYRRARQRGELMLAEGKVGAFLVAGGQGTRLGYDGPKGEYPVTPIKAKPLFQVFAEQILAASRRFGRPIPWYVMTSDINDRPTRDFFRQNNYFGLDSANLFFFEQGMMPAFSFDGKILLAGKDAPALSPDGHGGSLRALECSGALADLRRRGVEHLSYFQVDNPLVHCIDPLFLGLHELTGSEMSSKTIPKAGPLEKVGNFVQSDGIVRVIEYSDLPEELARQTRPDGSLRFNAGSIAIHAMAVRFIERLNAGGRLQLPWHRAEKKVPFIDESGAKIEPDKPNAVKLEQFVFDAIPLAKNAMIYTTDRAEEFSPVKNAEGPDSPATSRRDQIRRAARWLSSASVQIPMKSDEPDCVLEISPLFAATAGQLRERANDLRPIQPGEKVYLGK